MLTESLGYVGSGLIVVSLAMSSVLHLRMVNLIGSLTFGVYAVMIDAVPVLLTNIVLVVVNLHHIRRLMHTRPRGTPRTSDPTKRDSENAVRRQPAASCAVCGF